MTEILDAIEFELVGAVRRHNAGARRRRLKAAIAGTVAAVALGGATVTATLVDPISTLFPRGAEAVRPVDDARSTAVVRDDAGVSWRASAYRTRDDMLATVVLPRPRPRGVPDAAARSGLLYALAERDGDLAAVDSDVVERDGRVHVVVAGTAVEQVESVAVTVGGERFAATVAETAVRVPVALGPHDIASPQLERQLEELPDEVGRRAFAVALPSAQAPVRPPRVEVAVELTFPDGRVTTERSTLCVSPTCRGR